MASIFLSVPRRYTRFIIMYINAYNSQRRASFNIKTRGVKAPQSPLLAPQLKFSTVFSPLVCGPFFAALRPLFRPFRNVFVKSNLLIFPVQYS